MVLIQLKEKSSSFEIYDFRLLNYGLLYVSCNNCRQTLACYASKHKPSKVS